MKWLLRSDKVVTEPGSVERSTPSGVTMTPLKNPERHGKAVVVETVDWKMPKSMVPALPAMVTRPLVSCRDEKPMTKLERAAVAGRVKATKYGVHTPVEVMCAGSRIVSSPPTWLCVKSKHGPSLEHWRSISAMVSRLDHVAESVMSGPAPEDQVTVPMAAGSRRIVMVVPAGLMGSTSDSVMDDEM